jgi:LacI family transcriptional regulator
VASNGLISNVNERIAAAEAVALAAGARLEVLYVGFTLAENRAGIARRLATGPCPDALFTLNNVATLGALGAIGDVGLDVPDDIALVGFDDAEWMEVAAPPITAVQQPVDTIGRAAWTQLMARLAGDAGPPVETRLQCRLIIRASTAPRRAATRSNGNRERYRETIWPS